MTNTSVLARLLAFVLAVLAIVGAGLALSPAHASETPDKRVGFVCTVDEDKFSGLAICTVPRDRRFGTVDNAW